MPGKPLIQLSKLPFAFKPNVGPVICTCLQTGNNSIACRFRASFSTSGQKIVGYKLKINVQECYNLFSLPEDCTEDELRERYLRLAKQYHPDSGTATADPHKFSQIQEAYLSIKRNRSGEAKEEDDENIMENDFDIRHTVPQHRQYLDNEGIGFGTTFQRHKQYQNFKITRVTERVFEHRMKKFAENTESKALVDNKKMARKIKTSNAIERLVEDLIQDAMNQGDFDNLPGKGKPLQYDERNPLVDFTTHNLNKILINNGYVPEWITKEKEIREMMKSAREKLAIERYRIGSPPYSSELEARWNRRREAFEDEIRDVNKLIDEYNLVVPIMDKQMVHYNLKREFDKVYDSYKQYLPEEGVYQECDGEKPLKDGYRRYPWGVDREWTDWGEIWQNIKDNFTSNNSKKKQNFKLD